MTLACRALVPFALAACTAPTAEQAGDYAFVGVTVIPMDRETPHVLAHRTVVVERGTITAIVDADAPLAPSLRTIDAAGMYLVPGFSDMHVHYWLDDWDGPLFVAQGITRVRNMHGDPLHLALARRIASGQLLGPELRTTGPALDGPPVFQPGMIELTTPAQARAEVARQAAAGYEMLKVYSSLAPDVYMAVVAAAAERGMRVVGHVPDQVGVIAAAPHQDSEEHLLRFDLTGTHEAQVTAAIEHGLWSCPTFVAYDRVRRLATLRQTGIRGDEYVDPLLKMLWSGLEPYDVSQPALDRVLRDFTSRGGGLLVGTDANISYVVPGYAYHDELKFLVDAGLSSYDVLRAATYNAAAFFDELDRAGTIAVGRDADLVLLARDPIADIRNTRDPVGVMVDGAWYDATELAARLEQTRRARAGGSGVSVAPHVHAHH